MELFKPELNGSCEVYHQKVQPEKSYLKVSYKVLIVVTAFVTFVNFIVNISDKLHLWGVHGSNKECYCSLAIKDNEIAYDELLVLYQCLQVELSRRRDSAVAQSNESLVLITDHQSLVRNRFKRDDRRKGSRRSENRDYNRPEKTRPKKATRKKRKKLRGRRTQYKEKSTGDSKILHVEIDSSRETVLKTGKQESLIDFWKLSDEGYNKNQAFAEFHKYNGTVTVLKSGFYYLYSQLTYFDKTGRWSHTIDVSSGSRATSPSTRVKCLTSEWGMKTNPDTQSYYNTVHQCYTGRGTYITKGQVVSIRSMYVNRTIHADSDMSFWGLIKL